MSVDDSAAPERLLALVATYQLGRRLVAASGVVEAHLGAADGGWLVVSRLSAPWSQDGTFVERFAAHVRAHTPVQHAGVAELLEFGSGGDGLWFAERTADGEPLRALMTSKAGSLSVDECVEIARAAAEGLTALHAERVLHGDLSASSLFVTSAGAVVLLHTGVAVVAGSHASRGPARSEPHAVAPEQLSGPSSAATDVFRLGLLFLEMLTGRSLFVASDPQHVLGIAQKFKGVPPSAFHGVPEQLQSLLGWMMQREPVDRPHISEVSNVLQLASSALGLASGDAVIARAFRRLMVDRQPPMGGRTTELRLQPPKPSMPPPSVPAPRPATGASSVLGRIETRRVTHEQLKAVRLEDETPKSSPPASASPSPMREAHLGEQLVRSGKLTPAALAESVQRSAMLNLALGDTLLIDGVLTEDDVVEALATVTRTPFVTGTVLAQLDGGKAPLHLLSQGDAERLVAIPLSEKGAVLAVAVIDPLDQPLLEALKLATGRTIQAVRAGERGLRDALTRLYGGVNDDDPDSWLDRGPGAARKSDSGVTSTEPVETLTVSEDEVDDELELEGRPAARARSVTVAGLDEGQTKLVEVLLNGFGDPGREGIALVQLSGELARRLSASAADVDKARFVTAAVVAHNLSRSQAIWSAPALADFDAHLGPLALPVKALVPALFDGGKTMPQDLVGLAVFCTFVFAQLGGSTCPAPWQPVIASMRARRLPSVALEALTRALEA